MSLQALDGQARPLEQGDRVREERPLGDRDAQGTLGDAHARRDDARPSLLAEHLLQPLEAHREAAGRHPLAAEVVEDGVVAAARGEGGRDALRVALEDDARVVVEGVDDREVEAEPPLPHEDRAARDELAELLGATLARLDAGRPQELVDAVDDRDVAVQARHLVQGAPLSVREPLRGVHVLVEGDEVGLVDVAEHAPGELVGDVAGGQQRGQRADRPADDPPVGDVQPGEDLGEELDHLGLRALAAAAHELDAELGELARLPLERGLLAHHGSGVPEAAGQLVARDPRCHQARDGQREVGAQHQQAAV